jgi:hypothetical protein
VCRHSGDDFYQRVYMEERGAEESRLNADPCPTWDEIEDLSY